MSWRERYTPYGEKLTDPPENRDEPGFTSHVQDHATGLTYMQARYYDPMLGRFLSIDPIGHEDQLNLYAYVGNDPINSIDPDGQDTQTLKINADAVVGVGPGVSFGFYLNTGADADEDFDFGVIFSVRAAAGGDVSAGISTSTIDGPAEVINGLSTYSSIGGGSPAIGAIPGVGVDFVEGKTVQNPIAKKDPDFEPTSIKEFSGTAGLLPVSAQHGVELSGKFGFQDIKSMMEFIWTKLGGEN